MVASLPWKCVAGKMAIIEDRLLSDMLGRHHHYDKWFSEWVDLVYDKNSLQLLLYQTLQTL